MPIARSSNDPFASILAPPPGETPEAKAAREQAEAEARKVSEDIDEQLRQERIALKKKKKPVKVLLLGQSESGKSATLKNFQLRYARREWAEDRAAWRAVIFLNLIRNVIHVLDALLNEMCLSDGDRRSGTSSPEIIQGLEWEPSSHTPFYRFTDKHRLLKIRLAPLRRVQTDLEKRLGPGSQEVYSSAPTTSVGHEGEVHSREFGIISSNGWKSVLEKLRRSHRDSYGSSIHRRREEERYDISDVLVGCRQDMKNLWGDTVVRQILAHRKLHIEDSPGFFLNDVERIASPDYQPSDDDVLRARLRTVGIQEHKFVVDEGQGREWIMYDVGGTRSSRAVWASFFDDADAIIFLSPVSCFDEKLREDSNVNRLEDSFHLWRSVCSSPMLAKTQIILFLNKCDLLHNKLKRGVRVRDHFPDFGDRKNSTTTVIKYFQSHFKEISKSVSPERSFFVHLTSVIDTKATAATLRVVEESILRSYLRKADLL